MMQSPLRSINCPIDVDEVQKAVVVLAREAVSSISKVHPSKEEPG
jgi:hypothetical protein